MDESILCFIKMKNDFHVLSKSEMKIEVGRYEMDLDFDPRIQNNASDKMIPIDDIGFIYNCVFKQKKAFEYSVEAIRRVYRDAKIYVVSDGSYCFQFFVIFVILIIFYSFKVIV